jgi:DNA recombination protein RmuC
MEKARTESYSGLRAQVQSMAQQSELLRGETAKLAQAMSNPNVRGRYGEIQLQRVAELSGMQGYCDFDKQATLSSDGKVQRPDMIVRLPNERMIAVDAKTNIGAYLESLDAKSPELAEQSMRRFADHVVEQAQALGRKGYWKQFADSPELVVMFVPGDQFLDGALQRRPDLIELSARANVILATPSTLIGLLRAVNVGWREKKLADSARELLQLGSELHTRFSVAIGHAESVGTALDRAVREYNQLAGSIDARVMPTLRKFEEAGARKEEPIKELKPIESAVRAIASGAPKAAPAEQAPAERT